MTHRVWVRIDDKGAPKNACPAYTQEAGDGFAPYIPEAWCLCGELRLKFSQDSGEIYCDNCGRNHNESMTTRFLRMEIELREARNRVVEQTAEIERLRDRLNDLDLSTARMI